MRLLDDRGIPFELAEIGAGEGADRRVVLLLGRPCSHIPRCIPCMTQRLGSVRRVRVKEG